MKHFGTGKSDRQGPPVVRGDHGKPTHRAHVVVNEGGAFEQRWSDWVYCEHCLAEKDGHYPDGTPRFTGGLIRVQYRDPERRLRVLSARCTCQVGERWRRAFLPYTAFTAGARLHRELHDAVGEVVKVFVPGEGKGVRVSALSRGATA